MRLLLAFFSVALLFGCTTGDDEDAGPGEGGMDAGQDAGGPLPDAGPRTCTTNVDCDDGFPCTIDNCVVGNVCDYTPVDARCAMDERCIVGRGCAAGLPADCQRDEDCDDGDACTGTERCAREMCIPGRAFDCDDGNACTTDICDDSLPSMCRYETAPGCDAGPMGGVDAGPGCDPFVPATHYSGRFIMAPSQNCGAGLDMYSVNRIEFSTSGGTLTAQVGRFRLTQTPAPTGPSFSVSGTDACASITLTGTFVCADQFSMGSWTANHSGNCAACGSVTTPSVMGVRE